ncbi:hypothetical protein MNBD_ALPHA06-1206, partial [hydrothermal vent metagenome]
LSLVDSQHYTCGEVFALTKQYTASVSAKIADLKKLERTLKAISKECTGDDTPNCPIVEALYG